MRLRDSANIRREAVLEILGELGEVHREIHPGAAYEGCGCALDLYLNKLVKRLVVLGKESVD